ncbi:hypothetical protein BJ508DRAFT_217229, partial [Ascobolus immersus RN42]
MIRNLIKQPYLDGHFYYTPVRWYGANGERIIGPCYTGDQMWEQADRTREGEFIILVEGISDEGLLTVLCGDKSICPGTITLGNIDARYRKKPSMVPAYLRPVISKQVAHAVLQDVFAELEVLYQTGMKVVCPDGKVRQGRPILSGWLADFMEIVKLFCINKDSCPVCSSP